MGNSNNHTGNNLEQQSADVGCFCISNANVDHENEMYINDKHLVEPLNPREIVRQSERQPRGQHRNQNRYLNSSGAMVMVTSTAQKKYTQENVGSKSNCTFVILSTFYFHSDNIQPFKNITNTNTNNANKPQPSSAISSNCPETTPTFGKYYDYSN